MLLEKCKQFSRHAVLPSAEGRPNHSHACPSFLSSPASIPLLTAAPQEWLAIGNGLRDLGEVLPLDAQDWFAVRCWLQGCALECRAADCVGCCRAACPGLAGGALMALVCTFVWRWRCVSLGAAAAYESSCTCAHGSLTGCLSYVPSKQKADFEERLRRLAAQYRMPKVRALPRALATTLAFLYA